jgi:hypothetical protein
MIAILDPKGEPTAVMVGKGMPPLGQHFWRLLRQTNPLLPQRARTPRTCGFFLQTGRFQETAGRAMIAIVDPSQAQP